MTPTPRTDAILADDTGDSSLIRNLATLAHQLERENAELLEALEALRTAIEETLEANSGLADGDDCTLKALKDAVGWR